MPSTRQSQSIQKTHALILLLGLVKEIICSSTLKEVAGRLILYLYFTYNIQYLEFNLDPNPATSAYTDCISYFQIKAYNLSTKYLSWIITMQNWKKRTHHMYLLSVCLILLYFQLFEVVCWKERRKTDYFNRSWLWMGRHSSTWNSPCSWFLAWAVKTWQRQFHNCAATECSTK